MKKHQKKTFLSYHLPVALSIILVVGGGIGVWFLFRGERMPQDVYRTVINLDHPIIKNPDEINNLGGEIQVKFSWEIDGYRYNDALYFTPEQYAALTPEKLDSLKQERLQNWANAVNEGSNKSSE